MSEYDYIVEEFNREVKLDKDKLIQIINEYRNKGTVDLYLEFKSLWPENTREDIENIKPEDIPNTIIIPTYYLQSPKDKITDLPSKHYALNEIILQDAQMERDNNKNKMKQAYKNHDMDNYKRFNAMQLGLKVISNSFYGASGNKTFAHYDPDVAGTITWAARQCIRLLTDSLLSTEFYVDDEFINDDENIARFEILNKLGFIKMEKINDYSKITRRNTIRRLFDDFYNLRENENIYKISKPRCEVVYQDTDSNYFECSAVQSYYLGINPHDKENTEFKCSPEIIYQMMNTMICLDLYICSIVDLIIGRKPVGLGFEGSFVVCRYLNRKKKYYGIKAADDDGNVFPYKLCLDAYNKDGKLRFDFDMYWKPGKQLIPQSNGEYVLLNNDVLLNKVINFLDYINSMNVKVTGVDLTRRDQYKFILYYHVMVLRTDLRICKYNKDTLEWEGINLNQSLTEVVDDIIEQFRDVIMKFKLIANLQSDELPNPCFRIEHFTKNQRYQPSESKNNVYHLIQRYIEEGKNNYIPDIGERVFYVVLNTDEGDELIKKGVKKSLKIKDAMISLNELFDIVKTEYPEDEFDKNVGQLKLTYDEYINAVCISKLYHKHYLTALASALALYLFGEKFPDVAEQIDKNEVDDESEIVTKYQKKIANEIVERYYPSTKIKKITHMTTVKLTKRELSNKDKTLISLFNTTFKKYPDYNEKNRIKYLNTSKSFLEQVEKQLSDLLLVRSIVLHDKFSLQSFDDVNQKHIYEKYNRGEIDLDTMIKNYNDKKMNLLKIIQLIEYNEL